MKDKSKRELENILSDLQSILITYRAYNNVIDQWKNKTIPNTQKNHLLTCAVMESLERDMIVALCRLDDDKNLSFRTVMRNSSDYDLSNDDVKKISKAIASYRKAINPIKTQNRNKYIAHLSKAFDGSLPPVVDLKPLLRHAIDTMSCVLNSKINWEIELSDTGDKIILDEGI